MADKDFLARWSRRKLARKEGGEASRADERAVPPDEADAAAEPTVPVTHEPEAVEDDGPPPRHPAEDIDIDSLTRDSDFTIFMQTGVPAAVRRKALRKLWTSDPVLANLDGLNDYEVWDKPFGPKGTQTAWKIGRGFLTDRDLGIEPEAAGTEAQVSDQTADEEQAETDGTQPPGEDLSESAVDESKSG